MEDKISTIKARVSTKARLEPYRAEYGTYEKAILELIKSFEE